MCVTRINKNKIETFVYRKTTNINIYINWYSHAPSKWKTGILRNIIKGQKLISSTKLLLRDEIAYLRKVFTENNDSPLKVVNHIINQELLQPLEVEVVKIKNHDTEQKMQLPGPVFWGTRTSVTIENKKQLKKCPNEGCKDDYVGETKRRIVERIKDHNSKDNSSHLLKHAHENGHTHVWEKDF